MDSEKELTETMFHMSGYVGVLHDRAALSRCRGDAVVGLLPPADCTGGASADRVMQHDQILGDFLRDVLIG